MPRRSRSTRTPSQSSESTLIAGAIGMAVVVIVGLVVLGSGGGEDEGSPEKKRPPKAVDTREIPIRDQALIAKVRATRGELDRLLSGEEPTLPEVKDWCRRNLPNEEVRALRKRLRTIEQRIAEEADGARKTTWQKRLAQAREELQPLLTRIERTETLGTLPPSAQVVQMAGRALADLDADTARARKTRIGGNAFIQSYRKALGELEVAAAKLDPYNLDDRDLQQKAKRLAEQGRRELEKHAARPEKARAFIGQLIPRMRAMRKQVQAHLAKRTD